jgi:hypothetical protein
MAELLLCSVLMEMVMESNKMMVNEVNSYIEISTLFTLTAEVETNNFMHRQEQVAGNIIYSPQLPPHIVM